MTRSEAWADLGGIVESDELPTPRPTRPRRARRIDDPRPVHEEHMFDPDSGWCTCGVRDDGADAFGSPAWRRRVESALPDASS